MKKLIPLILVLFVLGFGRNLRSDEMRHQQEKPWVANFSASIDRNMEVLLGNFKVGGFNVSKCSVLP